MKKTKKAILFGTSGQAEVMNYLLTIDSEYEIVAFTSTSDYIDQKEIYGKPLVAFEDIEKILPHVTDASGERLIFKPSIHLLKEEPVYELVNRYL